MVASAPRHVTAADKKGVITVRWSAPSSDGGSAITSYTVVSLPKAQTCVTSSMTCSFKGLNKKLHYSFESASDEQGWCQRPLGEIQRRSRQLIRLRAARRLLVRS